MMQALEIQKKFLFVICGIKRIQGSIKGNFGHKSLSMELLL